MQLVEYYSHKSLSTNNINMNKISAYFDYFLIISQPIILNFVSYNNIDSKSQNILIFLCLSFIIFGLFSFYKNYKSKKFRISYLENICKNTICRLEWEYFNINFFHNLIFALFYFGITIFVGYNQNPYNITILPVLVFYLV